MKLNGFIKFLMLAVVLSMLLAGCGSKVQVSDIVNKTYVYEKEGFGGDFEIVINEDGTFSYYEGLFSSYIGAGEWTLKGDTLILADDVNFKTHLVNYFTVEGDDLVFQAEKSTNFIYMKVADGERFTEQNKE